MSERQAISNGQRAVWTFLMYTLVAPFLAGVGVTAALFMAGALGLTGGTVAAIPPERVGEAAAVAGLRTFIWGVLPAALTAFIVLPGLLKRGTFGWIEAAAGGVVAFAAAAAAVFPFEHGGLLPVLAFAAGLVSLALRAILIRGGVILAGQSGRE